MGREEMKTISVADEFSPFPAGRYDSDGPYNGARFRDKYLLPLLEQADTVVVNIDRVVLLPSSFWQEIWGGMVRDKLVDKRVALTRFRVATTDDELKPYVGMATQFINEAEPLD